MVADRHEDTEALAWAHVACGPAGPAICWVNTVLGGGDFAAGWPDLDPLLRQEAAGLWLWSHRDILDLPMPDIGDTLARWANLEGLEAPLFRAFCTDQLEICQTHIRGLSPASTWGTVLSPHPVDLDHELVLFALGVTEQRRAEEGECGVPFVMRNTDEGWKIRRPFSSKVPSGNWAPPELAPYLLPSPPDE